MLIRTAVLLTFLVLSTISCVAGEKPNVLFIAIDDLNHWVTHLDRNDQAKTPNIDRLAKMGVSFAHAYCAVPACEPSRCALMSGRRPWTSGCYKNGDSWKEYQKPGEGLSAQFLRAGYHTVGAGKIYHSMDFHPSEWTDYMSKAGFSPNGPGVQKMDGYHEPHEHDVQDDDLIDFHSVDYCIRHLQEDHEKPFFIACGLYKPHLPFVAPRKYYEDFPLAEIKLPPFLESDLDDLPPAGVKMAGPGGDHKKFKANGRWKAAIQSYLATCAYTDMNVGRLLDSLDASPHKDNTIIVLWSDHGWSFGEKKHWRKFALWEEPTRMPFIWVAPGITTPGTTCDRTVDLMSVFPTLCDLTGLETPKYVEGQSIRSLLDDPNADWQTPAITTHGFNNHAVRSEKWRYIRYANGEEELYDEAADPYEWKNLANNPEYGSVKTELASWLPKKQQPAKLRKK